MQKNEKNKSSIIILSVIILSIFTYISAINIIPANKKSESYYSKIDGEMFAKIENISYTNKKLTVNTSGNTEYICIKTTKSRPTEKSSCWKKVENNIASTSIYEHKYYYIWIMDSDGKVSSPTKFNVSELIS